MTNINVLIINPPVRLNDKPRNIPHGLSIIANVIREKMDIKPIFLDVNAHRYNDSELENIIRKINFDIVLIGGIAPTYKFIVKIAELVKKINPYSKVIAGGYVVMPLPDLLLRNSPVDITCTGEGEITVIELLSRFQKEGMDADLSGITGICYKKGEDNKILCTADRPFIENLDKTSPSPAYDLLPMDIYLSNCVVGIGKDIDMVTMRGCPFNCSFC